MRKCQRWEEMLSGEVMEFEEHTVGMIATGLCRCKGNAEWGLGRLPDDQERGFLETHTELAQKGDMSYNMEKSAFWYCSSPEVNFSELWVASQWETKLFLISPTMVALASIIFYRGQSNGIIISHSADGVPPRKRHSICSAFDISAGGCSDYMV